MYNTTTKNAVYRWRKAHIDHFRKYQREFYRGQPAKLDRERVRYYVKKKSNSSQDDFIQAIVSAIKLGKFSLIKLLYDKNILTETDMKTVFGGVSPLTKGKLLSEIQ